MQEEKEKRISQSTVIGLGFTKTMIDKLLPPPVLVKNPHYKSSPPMKLWLESEVMEIMQTAEYQREKEKADKRRSAAKKAVATKTNNLSRQIDNMIDSIRIKIIADDVLVSRTIKFKQNWFDAHRDEMENYMVIKPGSINDLTLQRWVVNYIRHQLTIYEAGLSTIEGKTGSTEVYQKLKIAVLNRIAVAYPKYKEECERQISYTNMQINNI